jgi:RimJ/RimL family protein N-acetyltransferase
MMPVSALNPRPLKGKFVTLEPLEPRHHDALIEAGKDMETWRFISIDPKEGFAGRLSSIVRENEKGAMHSFVVRRNSDKAVVGSTSYLAISPPDAKLEIGWTWYVADARGGPVNPECKYFLMRNAFEDAGYHRVEFKTDVNNARSRAALKKLGANEEGILREHIWMAQGYFRTSVYYSVLAAEWPGVKAALKQRLSAY